MTSEQGELPKGWAWSAIGDLVSEQSDGRTIHQGWSPKCEKQPSESHSTWGVLKTTAIQAGAFDGEHNKQLPQAKEPRPLLEVAPGDLLLTCAGPRQRCGVATLVRQTRPRLMISGKMYRFRFDHAGMLPEYVEAYLLSAEAWQRVDKMKTGGSESGLNLTQSRFRTLPVPVSPVAEQERIVAAIEEHLSRLDAAVAVAEAAARRVRELFESALRSELDQLRAPATSLGDLLLQPLSNGRSVRTATASGSPVLRLTCLRNGSIDTAETKLGDWGDEDPARFQVKPDDFLISRGNGSLHLVGRGGLVPANALPVAYPDTLIRARVDPAAMRPSFLRLVWNGQATRRQLESQARTTAGIYKVNQSMLEQVNLPLPSVDAQDELVQRLMAVHECAQQLDAELGRAQLRAQSLRCSILAAAFSGQLVPQDPGDEPAAVLLQRIAAERAPAKPTPKTDGRRHPYER